MRPLSVDIMPAEEPGAVAQGEETLIADSAITEEPEPFLAEEVSDEDAAPVSRTPTLVRHFSWFTALLYLLGIASLGVVAAAPFLPMQATSDPELNQRIRSAPDRKEPPQFLLRVPAAAAAIVLVGLLASVAARHFGVATLLTAYLGIILSGVCLAFWGLLCRWLYGFDQKLTAESALRYGRAFEVTFGLGAWAAIGGCVAATLLLAFAILRTHRRLWAKLTFATLVLVGLGLAGAFAFLVEPTK
jgi:hypothetical protein